MITFRPITREDLPFVHEWHQRPHVKRWWVARDTLEETEGHYVPTIDGTEPTDHYLALLDGEPFAKSCASSTTRRTTRRTCSSGAIAADVEVAPRCPSSQHRHAS